MGQIFFISAIFIANYFVKIKDLTILLTRCRSKSNPAAIVLFHPTRANRLATFSCSKGALTFSGAMGWPICSSTRDHSLL